MLPSNQIRFERTKRGGVPALWESGGATSNKGRSTVITLPNGRKPKAAFITRRGPRACGDHALVTIRPGMYVIDVRWWRGGESVRVSRIVQIDLDNNIAELEEANPIPDFLADAVEAARRKSRIYHCRSAIWVEEKLS